MLQDMMYCAIHIRRAGTRSLHHTLFNVSDLCLHLILISWHVDELYLTIFHLQFLSQIHKNKMDKGFGDLLFELYQPILWRSLSVANHDVRANAAQIFFDLFPFIKSEVTKQQMEEDLQKNFDLLVVSSKSLGYGMLAG